VLSNLRIGGRGRLGLQLVEIKAAVRLENLSINEANSPLAIDPIPDVAALAGTPVTVVVTANATSPGDQLVYSLDPGAPAGAKINPSTGVFTWQIPESEPVGEYDVTVSDSSRPPASLAKSMRIMVASARANPPVLWPPRLSSAPGAHRVRADLDGGPR
jgi:hypothetical protein